MFEKYGSLIRYLRGNLIFDPYTATMPDEYFFIVLSLTVTGAAALWRWDALFLDRRDYTNLVPLPVSLRAIFFANLSAIFALAALFTIVVNAASLILYQIAVVGSQNSFAVWGRFALGHTIAVLPRARLASSRSSLLPGSSWPLSPPGFFAEPLTPLASSSPSFSSRSLLAASPFPISSRNYPYMTHAKSPRFPRSPSWALRETSGSKAVIRLPQASVRPRSPPSHSAFS
jgi:hypothetical protein